MICTPPLVGLALIGLLDIIVLAAVANNVMWLVLTH
jgi:hypothetical protein